MQLEKHGLGLITPETCVTALSPDGRALSLYTDENKSAQSIAAFSQKDAAKYPEFEKSLGKISKVIAEALATTPPDIDYPSGGDMWSMLKTGRALRNLGKRDMYRVQRWGPMAVADLVAEYVETELLRAVIAARGIFGTFLGPWSAGSSLQLLIRECIPVSNAIRLRGMAPNTSRIAFGVVLSFCSRSTSPTSSSRQYQLDRSPRSRPIVSLG
jgi:phytoene dehydrogenase-like protein